MSEHRSIAELLRRSSGRLALSYKVIQRTVTIGLADHSIHVIHSIVEEAYTLGTLFHFFTIPIYSIAIAVFLVEEEYAARSARCAFVSCRRVDTLPVQGQKFCPSVRYVTRWVCRTQISRCLHDCTSDHLGPVKGEFEGRSGGQLIWYTLDFHHLSNG